MRLADEIIRLFSGEEFFKNSLKLIQNCIIKDNSLKEQEDINTRVMIQGLSGGSKNAYIYSLFKKLLEDYSKNKNNKKVPRLVYITTTAKESEEAFFDIKTLSNESPYLEYFPDWGTIEYEHISPFQDIIHQRIEVLHKLVIDEPLLIIMPIKALMRTIVPPDIFRKEYIDLKTDEDYNLESLLNLFIELGYERVEKVAESGTFTLKGGILDIFPSAFENPARIEFWGDTIESIRLFDPISQKSIQKNIKDLEILPQRELIYTDEHISRAIDIINERFNDKYRNFNTIIENLLNKQHFQGVEQYQPFFYPEASIIDYLDDSNAVFVFNEKENIEKFSTKIIFETESLYNQSHRVKEVRPRPDEIYQDFSEIKNRIKRFADISTLIKYDENYDDEEFPVYEDEQSIVISAKQITSEHNFRGDFSYFTDFLEENPDKAIIIMSPYEAQARRLQSALARYNPLFEYDIFGKNNNKSTNNNLPLKKSQIYIAVGNYNIGFGTSSFYLIPDREIRGKKRSYSKKLRRINSAPIESFLDLKKGDYVVHINYGIGKFIGIERMKIVDKERDFIHILYADEEKLYVPIEQLNLVQKYIGGDVRKVKLDKMGGKSWERTKKRVQKSIEDMAEELLKIYSARKKLRGYAFSKDTPYQLQFESEFIYEETPDQIKAIEEVKRDMELDKPMDRLICGDVGYGKTEVAIRSAFKTIMDGKQVAVLVPTTI
ncbi:MAG: CarD family transcriptional regulator, partial [Spirochaetota bacterium]